MFLLGGVYDTSKEEHNNEDDGNDGNDNISNMVTDSQPFLIRPPICISCNLE